MAAPDLISPLFPHYDDLDTVALHGLPSADFCGLAAFRLAVDSDFASSDQVFALPAAVGDAGEFQQIAEPDMLVLELKLAGFQGIPVVDVVVNRRRRHDTGTAPT